MLGKFTSHGFHETLSLEISALQKKRCLGSARTEVRQSRAAPEHCAAPEPTAKVSRERQPLRAAGGQSRSAGFRSRLPVFRASSSNKCKIPLTSALDHRRLGSSARLLAVGSGHRAAHPSAAHPFRRRAFLHRRKASRLPLAHRAAGRAARARVGQQPALKSRNSLFGFTSGHRNRRLRATDRARCVRPGRPSALGTSSEEITQTPVFSAIFPP